MFKSIADAFQQLLFLMRDTHETKANVEKLKERFQQLSAKVEALAFELERQRDATRHEHEKLAMQMQHMGETIKLRLENARLQSGNELPAIDSE